MAKMTKWSKMAKMTENGQIWQKLLKQYNRKNV